jgi:hypothetical protein
MSICHINQTEEYVKLIVNWNWKSYFGKKNTILVGYRNKTICRMWQMANRLDNSVLDWEMYVRFTNINFAHFCNCELLLKCEIFCVYLSELSLWNLGDLSLWCLGDFYLRELFFMCLLNGVIAAIYEINPCIIFSGK